MSQTKDIVIVGDANTAMGFKLAGLKRTYAIEGNMEDGELKMLLEDLCTDDKIGIIVVTDNLLNRVKGFMESGASPPIVVRIPKLQRPDFPDAKEYYKRQITEILGFGIEL